MKLKEEIAKLENIKKKAVEEENYDLAKETNNQILQKKELIQQLKEGKDIDIDNTSNKIEENENNELEKNNINNNNDINNNNNENNNNNKNKTEKKEVNSNEEGSLKRFVNRKKNDEKVSTGVSTTEKDSNNKYLNQKNIVIKPIDVDKQKVGNTLTFSQMVEKELSSNSQFSPYNNNNNNNLNDNFINKKNGNKKDIPLISEEDRDFINSINQFLPKNILTLLVSKNVKEI